MAPDRHTRTKGRNGWFVPRLFQADLRRDADGTLLVALRQYSRRLPVSAGAPSEWVLPLSTYRQLTAALDAAIDEALAIADRA
jgi:hypothetical protein